MLLRKTAPAGPGQHRALVAPGRGQVVLLRRTRQTPSLILRYRPDQREQPSETIDAAKKHATELLANLKALTQEAAALQSRLAAHVDKPAHPSSEVPENVLAARAWIAAWRAKQQQHGNQAAATNGSSSDAVPQNVASARAWIAAWRAKQQVLPSQVGDSIADASQVPENVAEARAWIAAWRSKQQQQQQQLKPTVQASSHAAVASSQGAAVASGAAPDAPKPKPAPAAPAAPVVAQRPFTNTNRFWVPSQLVHKFLVAVEARKAELEQTPGFTNLTIQGPPGASEGAYEGVYEVAVTFTSVPAWEEWSSSRSMSRHPLPNGVFQYVPAKGKGFPEDYLPFKDLAEAVNAKY